MSMYILSNDPRRRVEININHITQMERKKNPDTVADERVTLYLLDENKFRFEGQEAKDFYQDYRNLILPALGGVLNPPTP